MFDITSAIASVGSLADTIIKTIWPNPADEAAAEATKIRAAVQAEVLKLQATQAVMLAEAQSSDPWTSRARPSFMYVMYLLILASIPMGIVAVISPDTATGLIKGFNGWLSAIPENFTDLFMYGYLGYSATRSYEKVKLKGK